MQENRAHPSLILKQKRTELISSFLKGKEAAFIYTHAGFVDEYFRSVFKPDNTDFETCCAIIALGGYGREEQCIGSDIDLLILFEKQVPKKAKDLVHRMIYPLWDIRFEVGYSTQSLKECLSLAGENFETLTALLDARFICGSKALYGELTKTLKERLISRKSKKIITWLINSNEARHKHFGDSAYLLEPNLKEGRGGLRDYHTMLWISRIKFNLAHPRDLKKHGCFARGEFELFQNALSFIWNIRSRLLHMASRKCDQLFLEHQIKLADSMKFKKKGGQFPVERFLGELHGHMEFVKQKNLVFLAELGYLNLISKRRASAKSAKARGVKIKGGMLTFTSRQAVLKTPELLIRIFEESARLKISLNAEARRVIKDLSHLVDNDLRKSPAVIKSFEYILKTPSLISNVLNEMLNTGVLIKFVPEFKKIVNIIQFNEYHLYPVDRHLLITAQVIKKFGTAEDPTGGNLCGALYKELLGYKKLLLWAGLLHDIGKWGDGKDHSQKGAEIAVKILKRLGYKKKEIETVSFLIAEHLFLIKIARRRDINDEESAVFCARKVKDMRRLKMLYLLTVADCIATGSKAWNDWTATILRNLFLKIFNIMERGELATNEAIKITDTKKQKVVQTASSVKKKRELEEQFSVLSPRYLLDTSTDQVIKHLKLYQQLQKKTFVWNIEKRSSSGPRTITISANDCSGLFSKIAGAFTLNNLNILSAHIYTWQNNIALDIFEVTPPADLIFEDEKWDQVRKNIESALTGRLDLKAKIQKKISENRPAMRHTIKQPHRVNIDNNSSSFFTIIEVFTYDFPGLLFSITNALFECGINIRVAKIATNVDQVVDVFYVNSFEGEKIDDPDKIAEVKKAIEKVLLAIDSLVA